MQSKGGMCGNWVGHQAMQPKCPQWWYRHSLRLWQHLGSPAWECIFF